VKKTDKVVLGIDPGTNIMGYGVIHIEGTQVKLLAMDVLNMQKLDDHPIKLKAIFDRTSNSLPNLNPMKYRSKPLSLARTYKACSSSVAPRA
jgi:crossover junction endodeoxyribonuclease RuvC